LYDRRSLVNAKQTEIVKMGIACTIVELALSAAAVPGIADPEPPPSFLDDPMGGEG
jgi:hypothetical protein